MSDERVGFEIETLNKDPFIFSCCMIDYYSVKEHSLASSTNMISLILLKDVSNRQANDSKRALRGRQPTDLITLFCLLFSFIL